MSRAAQSPVAETRERSVIERGTRQFQRQRVRYVRAETYLDSESAAVKAERLAGSLDCPVKRARCRQLVIEREALRALEAVLGALEHYLREPET
jgi:hypothetical protein